MAVGVVGKTLRRFLVVSSSGLERCLEKELQTIGVLGRLEVVPGGVFVEGNSESLWRTVLQSRVAESVRLRLGELFYAPDLSSLDANLRRLPWEDFFRFPLAAPSANPTRVVGESRDTSCLAEKGRDHEGAEMEPVQIKVTSHKSRLFHTGLVQARVSEAIEARRALWSKQSAELTSLSSSSSASKEVTCRTHHSVHVNLRHDSCEVSVGASGILHQRGYRKSGGEAPLRETLAAACVLSSPFLRRLSAASNSGDDLVLWDPFCGSGSLLLEALGIAIGTPPGSTAQVHPFMDFPSHASESEWYSEVVRSIEPTPHPGLAHLTLLGTDTSEEQVNAARRNLRRFLRRLPKKDISAANESNDSVGIGSAACGSLFGSSPDSSMTSCGTRKLELSEPDLPCAIEFSQGTLAKGLHELAGRPTMILTNVPYGALSGSASVELRGARRSSSAPPREINQAQEAYAQFGRMLRQHRAEWRGVFCLAADHEEVERFTGLSWSKELSFQSGGSGVQLLQWAGRPSGGVSHRSGDGIQAKGRGRGGSGADGSQKRKLAKKWP